LENNIVWEPVDGQHIVAACRLAKAQEQAGLISEEEFRTRFTKHRAKFIVFKNPNLYIEASVMINAKEFEREFYSTMYEDMVKLHEIWVACGKPDPDVHADDAKRVDAVTQAASTLYWTISLVGKSTLLGALASGCCSIRDMHGRKMKRATMPHYKYARTMKKEDFGIVQRTTRSG
jgi:hypothetical protein